MVYTVLRLLADSAGLQTVTCQAHLHKPPAPKDEGRLAGWATHGRLNRIDSVGAAFSLTADAAPQLSVRSPILRSSALPL